MNEKTVPSKKKTRSVNRRRFLGAAGVCPMLSLASATGKTPTGGEPQHTLELTAEDRVALALMRFGMGFHCSQSVLETYAEDFGLESETARRMAAALAGGSTVGGECGAVSAGYLVLGLRHGRLMPAHGDVLRESELWDRIRRFVEEFRSRHGALSCRELLGVDVFTAEGREEGLRRNLFATRCPGFIRDAITIIEELG